jgi:hypothetical protein
MSPDMNDENDDGERYAKLDATLRGFLGAELDGQRGRARTAFETHVTRRSTRPLPAGGALVRGRPARSRAWVIGLAGAGAAMAASLAAVWAVPMFTRNTVSTTTTMTSIDAGVNPHRESTSRPGDTSGQSASAETDWRPVQQVTRTATVDQGLVLVGGTAPARVFRRVSTESTEWFDRERNVRVETTVPRERVMLIGVDTY